MIQHINRVFASHRFPDTVKTEGGPSFKGTGSPKYQLYMKWAGVKTIAVSPEDPEANGLAENFMKPLSKVRHHTPPPAKPQPNYCSTANSQCACQSYKSQYMTPNCINKMHRQQQRKRPTRILKVNVEHHNIQVNDKVLLLQQSKTKPRYDPYKVIKVQVPRSQPHVLTKYEKRDGKNFKKVCTFPPTNYRKGRYPIVEHCDTFIYNL